MATPEHASALIPGEASWIEFDLDLDLDLNLDRLGVVAFGVGAVTAKGIDLALKSSKIARELTLNRQTTTLGQRVMHPIATRMAASQASK